MAKRITIVLDDVIIKKLREKQTKLIKEYRIHKFFKGSK
jgi:hypothetical protein